MTIPQHLIDQAATEIYVANMFGDEFARDAWRDKSDADPVKHMTRALAQVALEAIAADIWQTGYNFGSSDEIMRTLGIITDNERTPNPYRIEHA